VGIQAVKNTSKWGLYVWVLDNGKVFADSDGNVMNIPGKGFEIDLMNQVAQAAKHYGAGSGHAKFIPGVKRVSEMRHSEEIDRLKEGLIASETDIGAWGDAQDAYVQSLREGWDYDEGR
jgi:hypothetical protein